jgi:hypothetical protein
MKHGFRRRGMLSPGSDPSHGLLRGPPRNLRTRRYPGDDALIETYCWSEALICSEADFIVNECIGLISTAQIVGSE